MFQSRTIPIPLFPSPDPNCLTFMGRLANEIINLTNPKTTIFLPSRQAWFDTKTQGMGRFNTPGGSQNVT